MAGKYILREACSDDCPRIHQLLQALTKHDQKPKEYKNDINTLMVDGFGKHPWYNCIVVEYEDMNGNNEGIVAIVMYTFGYDGWKGRVLHITDFFINKKHRTTKLGSILLYRLGEICIANKVVKMCGIVSRWNIAARRFYSWVNAIDYSTGVPDSQKQHYFASDVKSIKEIMTQYAPIIAEWGYSHQRFEPNGPMKKSML